MQTLNSNAFNVMKMIYENTENQINKLKIHKRNKRGLINGLGTVIKSISGNLDQNDAEHYEQLFEQIKENEHNLQKDIKNHLHYMEDFTKHFNEQINKIKINEKELFDQIQLLQEQINKQEYKNIQILLNSKIQLIISLLNHIQMIISQINESINFCSLHTFDVSLVSFENLKQMLPMYDIVEISKLLTVNCNHDKNKIYFIITIPIMSENTYDLHQMTMIPFKQNDMYYLYDQETTMYINNNVKVDECIISNKKYYCKTNNIGISNCINHLLHNNRSECEIKQITSHNNIIRIPNSNELIIFSPDKQNVKIDCKNIKEIKSIQGIFQISSINQCKINGYVFKPFANEYKEIKYQFSPLIMPKIISNKNITLQKLDGFTEIIPTMQPLNELNIKHETHFTILYVLLAIIILILVCYKVINKYKIKICKEKTSDESKTIQLSLSPNNIEHQISSLSSIS